jgi:hypothetical protein
MPGPDLTGVTLAAEQYLDDTVQLVVDADRVKGGALNEVTGLIEANADESAGWESPALITPAENPSRQTPSDLSPVTVSNAARLYTAMLPLSTPELEPGQQLQVLVSRRDPQLEGRRFRVLGGGSVSTYAVLRKVPLELLGT